MSGKMTLADFIKRLADFSGPDQGLHYKGRGLDPDWYDSQTGERHPGRYRSAELKIHADRADFAHDLACGDGKRMADEIADLIAQLQSSAEEISRLRAALEHIANEEFGGPVGISIYAAAANELVAVKDVALAALATPTTETKDG